jgi:hypothetical protein
MELDSFPLRNVSLKEFPRFFPSIGLVSFGQRLAVVIG